MKKCFIVGGKQSVSGHMPNSIFNLFLRAEPYPKILKSLWNNEYKII